MVKIVMGFHAVHFNYDIFNYSGICYMNIRALETSSTFFAGFARVCKRAIKYHIQRQDCREGTIWIGSLMGWISTTDKNHLLHDTGSIYVVFLRCELWIGLG